MENGTPVALCHFSFTDNHRDRFVTFALSLGDWTRDAPSTRRCFTIWYHHTPEERGFMLRDASDNIRHGDQVLGHMLSRAAALRDPALAKVWEIIDVLFLYDPVLAPYLAPAQHGEDSTQLNLDY